MICLLWHNNANEWNIRRKNRVENTNAFAWQPHVQAKIDEGGTPAYTRAERAAVTAAVCMPHRMWQAVKVVDGSVSALKKLEGGRVR